MPPIGRHFAVVSSAEVEVLFRVSGRAVDADLEVEVGAGGVAGGADVANHLALAHARAAGDGEGAHVRIERHAAAAVVYHDVVAVAVAVVGDDGSDAAVGGEYGRTARRANVLARVEAHLVEDGVHAPAVGGAGE